MFRVLSEKGKKKTLQKSIFEIRISHFVVSEKEEEEEPRARAHREKKQMTRRSPSFARWKHWVLFRAYAFFLVAFFVPFFLEGARGQEQTNDPAFDFLREAMMSAFAEEKTTTNDQSAIWNVVRAFGENGGVNGESWAVLKEAYERLSGGSSEDDGGSTSSSTSATTSRDAFLSRLMQSVADGSFGDGSLVESFGGEDDFFSGREAFLTRMLQDVIQSGEEGAVLGDGTFANRVIENLNAVEPRDALRSLIEAIQTSSSGDDNIVQSLSGIGTSSLPLTDEIQSEISRRLHLAASRLNFTVSESGNFTSEEMRLLGEKIIEDAILASKSDGESTLVSFESNFAPPLREVFLSFFSTSLRSVVNTTTTSTTEQANNAGEDVSNASTSEHANIAGASNTDLSVLVHDSIQGAIDSAVRFASDILFLNAGRNSTSANTDEVMALYDRVIGIMSSSRNIFTQVLADAAETNTYDDDDRESDTLRRAQQLLEAFRAANIANTNTDDDQVREMGGDEFSNAGQLKDRIIYPPSAAKQQTTSRPPEGFNDRAKKLLIAFSVLFVASFISIGVFNRCCSPSAKARRMNMIVPEVTDQHVNEQPSSMTYRHANDKENLAEERRERPPTSPPGERQNSETAKETTAQTIPPASVNGNQFVVRKSSLVRRAPSSGF